MRTIPVMRDGIRPELEPFLLPDGQEDFSGYIVPSPDDAKLGFKPFRMIPRGRLDISYADIAAGISYCIFPRKYAVRDKPCEVVCLSVRSGFDLVLQALQLPPGTEVIVTDINIPGMFEIITAHGLNAVPLSVNKHSLSISADDFKLAITSSSRVVLFTHLFGAIMDLDKLVAIAREKGLFIIEDCAQAYNGNYSGNPDADLVLFSFGMIKTHTCAGGALLKFKNKELGEQIRQLQTNLPQQSPKHFLKKLLIALLIQILSSRLLYSIFYRVLILTEKDPDVVLSGFIRGFPGSDLFRRIRYRPCMALRLFLERRLKKFDAKVIGLRKAYGASVMRDLPRSMQIGGDAVEHSFWVLPVQAERPQSLIEELRKNGYDATAKASSMIRLASHLQRQNKDDLDLDNLVYLPMDPEMGYKKRMKMLKLIREYSS